MHGTVIKSNRRFWFWTSLGLGLATFYLLASFARRPGDPTALIFGLLLGVGLICSIRTAFIARIESSFNGEGFTLGDGRRFVAWSDVDRVRVLHSGTYHELVLHIRPGTSPLRRRFVTANGKNPDEISVLLDHVSMPWQDIVRDVEAAAGTPIAAERAGPLGLGARPISRD
jgi:hypothetical protein